MADTSDDLQLTAMGHQHTIAVRHVVPMSEVDVGALFSATMPRLGAVLGQRSAQPSGAPYTRYYDFGGDVADLEIGIPVDTEVDGLPELAPDGEVGTSHLPAGLVARCVHRGPYDRLGEAYQRLERYFADEQVTPAGAPFEVYVVDPAEVDFDPERLVTEVNWPIAD
jgi:effector-binding domain-containing protein